ncbi:MAG: response regulator [Desulfomonilaceae bacterium]
MSQPKNSEKKRILAVDDEPDVIEVIQEQLEDYTVVPATSFESAHKLILAEHFDLAILDIMGVNGFALLDTCAVRRLPAAMLTAHALNIASINLAIKLGAISFLPKDELARINEYVAEILECLAEGKTHWAKLFERLEPLFRARLGVEWKHFGNQSYPLTFE